MGEWWAGLDAVTKGFYMAAGVFSVLFLWQFITSLIGLAGGSDVEVEGGGDVEAEVGAEVEVEGELAPGEHPEFEQAAAVDEAATVAAFRLLSVRSVLAFCLLFSWAGALYLSGGASLTRSLAYSLCWGLGAMVVVALLFYGLQRLTETGTPRLASCVGTRGTVYLDIPAGGDGEARVTVSGVVSHVRARGAGGQEIRAGTAIRVSRVLGPNTIEVEAAKEDRQQKGIEQ
jgi:membrane protein implicated in regulation of membrane protease activity